MEKKKKTKSYSVTLSEEHSKFVDNERRSFKLSKFVKISLDGYIDYVRRLRKEDGEKRIE
jgi:hypothetical protein